MLPIKHIIAGAIFSFLIYIIFPAVGLFGAALIFLASVFIDADHYIYYMLKYKDTNLKNAYKWFQELDRKVFNFQDKNPKLKIKNSLCFFHTFEFIFIILLLGFLYKPFLLIFLSLIFHSLFDMYDLGKRGVSKFREYSILLYLNRKNKKGWYYF